MGSASARLPSRAPYTYCLLHWSLLQFPQNPTKQAVQHEKEVRLLADSLEDPAREAEVELLRADVRYLKVWAVGQEG